ncbi:MULTISPECIES: RHS repeat-associated core domain-containing protein [unclassified Pseudoalteromonas]|uniref:RHS repeat-associated core domain-containing protein n=1 Tax=unclassified Pseudoalteromonas TaxID=194690 RepID=UPI003014C151
MQARYYDPVIGRFYSNDPVDAMGHLSSGNIQGFYRYNYAYNNPYKYTDPDGKHPLLWFIGKEIAGAIFEEATGVPVPSAKNAGKAAAKQLAKNKAAGAAFEKQVKGQLQKTDTDVAEQVTIQTKSGTKTRLDFVSKDSSGNVKCTECKASPTAPLTKNQKAGFPEIAESGGTVVGKGKPGFPGGTKIPPTKVDIIRKDN